MLNMVMEWECYEMYQENKKQAKILKIKIKTKIKIKPKRRKIRNDDLY